MPVAAPTAPPTAAPLWPQPRPASSVAIYRERTKTLGLDDYNRRFAHSCLLRQLLAARLAAGGGGFAALV
jgi:hypothetical protein